MRALTLVLLFAAGLSGQTPSFDAASIKPTPESGDPKREGPIQLTGGNINLEAASLWNLVVAAYGIKDYQLSGPDWMKSAHFDVVAKAPEDASLDQRRSMLQSLLADRFKLAVHHATKDLPVDALVVAKGTTKLGNMKDSEGKDSLSITGGKLQFQNYTMAQLAGFLARGNPDRPVVDATGIEGAYDFAVELDSPTGDPGDAKRAIGRAMADGTFARMVAEQLGLKVEARKQAIDIVVVDHAERVPVEN